MDLILQLNRPKSGGGEFSPCPLFPPTLFQKSVKHDIFSAPVVAKNLKIEAYFKLIFLNNFPTLVQQINHKKMWQKRGKYNKLLSRSSEVISTVEKKIVSALIDILKKIHFHTDLVYL